MQSCHHIISKKRQSSRSKAFLRKHFAGDGHLSRESHVIIRQATKRCLRYTEEDLVSLQELGKWKWLTRCDENDTIPCDWDGDDDPANPLNWRPCKIVCYALVVYMSAPIWTPGEDKFKEEFGTGYEYAELGLALYVWLQRKTVLAGVKLEPEHILIPAMVVACVPPIGLLLFGWLARPDIHWIAPKIGVGLYCGGVFVVFQNLHVYMAECYPRFAASLFAATDFTRSSFAVGTIMVGRTMYQTLGIGGASSLLAGLMILCIFVVFALHRYGPVPRKRSKFTTRS